MSRLQVDVRAAIPERQAPPPTIGEQLPRRVYIRRSVELARYGYTDRCIGCQHARLALKPADHSEESRARIVRNMTADDNFNQRVQIAQDRIVETAPPQAKTGERDSVREPARKKVKFAERVEEQTRDGTVATNSWSTSSPCDKCFQALGLHVFPRFGLTPGLAFDLRTGKDLNDPAHRAKCGHICKTKGQC